MVQYPGSISLRAGQIQFASPAAFVNNLGDFRVKTRPNKYHWRAVNGVSRPPVELSIAQLERQLYITENQSDSRTYIQYYPADLTKLALDCDTYSSSDIPLSEAFSTIQTEVLQPVMAFIYNKTCKQLSVDELVVEAACREVKPDNGQRRWKQSFHVFFPSIAITCKRIADLLDQLEIPSVYCDRAPWRGNGKKLFRLVGCCKESIEDVLKPYVPTASAARQHSLHHHVFTFLTGDEQDITDLVTVSDDRPAQRQRTQPVQHLNQDSTRSFSVASWLDKDREIRYRSLALSTLDAKGMGSGFELGRLKGSHMYGTTHSQTGRKCAYGCQHQSNNFYVDFQRSGAIAYHCHAAGCSSKRPVTIGQWCEDGLNSMLNSPSMWQPGCNVDAALLKNLENKARRATPKKERMQDQNWYPDVEETICRYLSNFWVFVSNPSVYVLQTLDSEGNVATYQRYDGGKLKNVVQPYEWAFRTWNTSHLRDSMSTKVSVKYALLHCRQHILPILTACQIRRSALGQQGRPG